MLPYSCYLMGLPITNHWFRFHLASVLTRCGLSPHLYAGNFFRIGAATTAAECSIPNSTIKTLGRWSSTAYKSYIRSNLWTLLNAQRTLLTYNQGIHFASYWWWFYLRLLLITIYSDSKSLSVHIVVLFSRIRHHKLRHSVYRISCWIY